MQKEKELSKDLEELSNALNQVADEYREYFEYLAALPSLEPSVTIVTGNTTTPYGESENA